MESSILSAKEKTFEEFITLFATKCAEKERQSNLLVWILETTGAKDAATLKAEVDKEYRLLFHDKETFEKLKKWDEEGVIENPMLARQLKVVLSAFKQNQMSKEILHDIADCEVKLSLDFANFRPMLNGNPLSQNDILEILKNSKDLKERQEVWELSKQVGQKLAPTILELVNLRNKGAQSLGYANYFDMMLDLQEVDKEFLFNTLEKLSIESQDAYDKTLEKILSSQEKTFSTSKDNLGPWAWADPFCQDDPLDAEILDSIYANEDLVKISKNFFSNMGYKVDKILENSDLYEREGKNQHAFCIHIDRKGDVRTLNNLTPTIRWAETLLHELGHAIYDEGYYKDLPWFLREPPHMITTEAMALICGRQAFIPSFINEFTSCKDKAIQDKAYSRLCRRQLVFSRWVLVITHFENELYQNPNQDLNSLWWSLVEKHQKIQRPKNREGKFDWAAKYHIGMAPVYYYSYLLGEMFASSMQEELNKLSNQSKLNVKEAKNFFSERLFAPGNLYSWDKLVENVIGKPLTCEAWIREFTNLKE